MSEVSQVAVSTSQTTSRQTSKPARLVWVDMATIASCFAVVMLHSSFQVFTPTHTKTWLLALATQACCIFAVNVFFMMSGALLMGYRARYSTLDFLKRRFTRSAMSLILASAGVYLLYIVFPTHFYMGTTVAEGAGIKDFLLRFRDNTINDTYWFLYAILKLYIVVIFISWLYDKKPYYTACVIVALILGPVTATLEALGLSPAWLSTCASWMPVGLAPLLSGAWLVRYHSKPLHWLYWTAGVVLSAGAMFFLGLHSNGWPQVHETYTNTWVSIYTFFGFFLSVSVFELLRSLNEVFTHFNDKTLRLVRRLSAASLGVYLIHIPLINWFDIWNILGQIPYIVQIPLTKALIIYTICVILVMLVQEVIKRLKAFLSDTVFRKFFQKRA